MPKPNQPTVYVEDLPPRERAAWTRYYELLAIGAQRRAEREAREARERGTTA